MELDEYGLRYGMADPALLQDYLASEEKRLLAIRTSLCKNSPDDDRLREIERELEIIKNAPCG